MDSLKEQRLREIIRSELKRVLDEAGLIPKANSQKKQKEIGLITTQKAKAEKKNAGLSKKVPDKSLLPKKK